MEYHGLKLASANFRAVPATPGIEAATPSPLLRWLATPTITLQGGEEGMARHVYYVLSAGDKWKVRYNDKDYSYDTQKAAIRASVDAAHKIGAKDQDAQVLIQGENGQWRTEWTYGHDPYPPPG
jgi:hypothetical protein